MDNKVEIGQRLEIWILKNFKTKTDFCKKAGISMQTLNNYKNGRSGIGGKFSSTLRNLGCDVEYLMTGRESANSPPAIQLSITESSTSTDNLLLIDTLHKMLALTTEMKATKDEMVAMRDQITELKQELEDVKQKQPGQTASVSVEQK